jgi:hypothetical protein
MHAQNAAEIRRRRRLGRSPPSARTKTVAGDDDDATSGLSTMTPPAAADEEEAPTLPPAPPPWRMISERDTARGEGSPARMLASGCIGGGATAALPAALGVDVDRPLRSPRSGSSQMRPDEPCRRNDTDDRCSLDIDRRSDGVVSCLRVTNGRRPGRSVENQTMARPGGVAFDRTLSASLI